jgi:hypothetical protein
MKKETAKLNEKTLGPETDINQQNRENVEEITAFAMNLRGIGT